MHIVMELLAELLAVHGYSCSWWLQLNGANRETGEGGRREGGERRGRETGEGGERREGEERGGREEGEERGRRVLSFS